MGGGITNLPSLDDLFSSGWCDRMHPCYKIHTPVHDVCNCIPDTLTSATVIYCVMLRW